MLVYLAYQFDLKEIPEPKLIRIMNDYFDFSINGAKDASHWIERYMAYLSPISERLRQLDRHVDSDAISIILTYGQGFHMKNHPLLDICFLDHERKKYRRPSCCPESFKGLNINAHHSGSEGFVDIINLKPEMDAYLHSIGIDYENRSKLEL